MTSASRIHNPLAGSAQQDGAGDINLTAILGRRPRILIGHPMLGRGGSEARVMWLIQALKTDCDVDLVTTRGWDLAALNEFYGTDVAPADVGVHIAPTGLPACLSAAALRGSLYQRYASSLAPRYDLCISAYNVTDWGRPAVHFIADFAWHHEIREKYDPPTPGYFYRNTFIRRLYLGMAAAFSSPTGRDPFSQDCVITNSAWSASMLEQYCPLKGTEVVFPPVWSVFPPVAWEAKKSDFVMIGRIAPEKRIERAVSILKAVRALGHDVRLHLCGSFENDAYGRAIARLCKENAEWIVVQGLRHGASKAALLSSCRYGLQTRAAEPFGISVAEMVKAGAIVFAPAEGGQADILSGTHVHV
jgi:glycosyltransferase involved in cell wall biosynthesis